MALANDIVEALARIRLSGEEMQCLWVIIRKTYGWHKKEDKISLSQFSNMTGLKRPAAVRALNHLCQKFIIIKKDNVGIISYCFQKDFDKWQPLSKKITFIPESKLKQFCYICEFKDSIERHHIISQSKQGSNKVENIIILCPNCHSLVHKGKISPKELVNKKDNVENVINNDNASSQKVKMTLSKKIHTKETLTKEIIQKKEYSSNFLSFWSEYPKKVGKPNAFKQWKKLKPDLNIILKAITIQKQIKENLNNEGKFCPEWPDPERWIKNKRWEDENQDIEPTDPMDRRLWEIERMRKNEHSKPT